MRYLLAGALILSACGAPPTEVAAVEKVKARKTLEEAETFHSETQQAIDRAEAAVREAERVVAEQEAAARRERLRASRTATTARSAPKPAEAAPAPAVVPQGEVQRAICDAFGSACAWALRVAKCESGYNPRATNGAHRGLFQVSTRWHAARTQRMGYTLDQLWEVGPNIAVALSIYNEQGGRPWSCK